MSLERLEFLRDGLEHSPVIGSLTTNTKFDDYLASESRVCVVANVAIRELPRVVAALESAAKFVFVNIDSCPGLGQDKGGIDYVQSLEVPGIVSTHLSLVQRANALGMVTIQKVFVTDRSNLPRSLRSVEISKPRMIELMPWPVIHFIQPAQLERLHPFIAAGFVRNPTDVVAALSLGAQAVGTSEHRLWAMTGSDFKKIAQQNRTRSAS